MKLIPAFFLVGLSIIHLIYVIAVPTVPAAEREKTERKRAAALSRFYRSKRFIPVVFPPKRRNDLTTIVPNYVKYVRIMSKKVLTSLKARLESQIIDFYKSFLSNFNSGQDLRTLEPQCKTTNNESIGPLPLQKYTNRNVPFQWIGAIVDSDKKLSIHTWSAFQVTTSVYETFEQFVGKLVSRIQRIAVNVTSERTASSLRMPSFQVWDMGTNNFAEAVTLGWSPVMSPLSLPQRLQKPMEVEELTSTTYVPEPSAAPSVEPFPEVSLEPSAEKTIKESPQILDHDTTASGISEKHTISGNADFYASVIAMFRTLTSSAAENTPLK